MKRIGLQMKNSTEEKKTIIIVGGGISGLTAGIYAQLNGFKSIILEQHSLAGGLCSYWERKGFHIDNCVHWLVGSRRGSDLNNLWRNTHVITHDAPIQTSDFFMQVELDGEVLHVWRNLKKLEEELLQLSPRDKLAIKEFIHLLNTYSQTVLLCKKPLERMRFWDKLKLFWRMRYIILVHSIYSHLSLTRYSERFKHPLIRKFLTSYFPHFYNASSMFFVYGYYCSGNADIPFDGSRGMVTRMVKRYEDLGGTIRYNQKVVSFNLVDKTVQAVKLADGASVQGDVFITTCDLYYVMQHLLPRESVDDYMLRHFCDKKHLYPTYSSVNVYLACDSDANILPGTILLNTNGLLIHGRQAEDAVVKDFNYEPTYSPQGKSLLQIIITQYENDADAWIALREADIKAYKAEKERIANVIREFLEKKYPAFVGKLQVLDVTTPATNHRFCSVYKGAYMSFALTVYNQKERHNGRVKGIDNLYLAGQWLHAPGGLSSAAVTGKFAVQRICHDFGVRFKKSSPKRDK